MVKVTTIYQGEKRCESTHPSGSKISTDAPKDNNGKGEAFSPTDLVATATVNCLLTIMAIHAGKEGIEIKGARGTVEKEMAQNPRRISKLTISLHLPQSVPHDSRKKLETLALACPVKVSLNPNIELPIVFHYDI